MKTTEVLNEMIKFAEKNKMELMELGSDLYDDCEVFKMKFRRKL